MATRMYDRIKSFIESATGERVLLEPQTDPERLRRFLERLKPAAPARPLVRLGSAGDGGYLVPDDLDGLSVLVSPGVSDNCDFDWDMAERGASVEMIDGSVTGAPRAHPNFRFQQKFLGLSNDAETVNLNTICEAYPDSPLMLQMDIEGAEYPCLMDLEQRHLEKFRIMAVEVHDFHHLFGSHFFDLARNMFDKVLTTHDVVHIHPNNFCGSIRKHGIELPKVLEFTFYHRSRGIGPQPADRRYPHPLDARNVADAPDIVLPRHWW